MEFPRWCSATDGGKEGEELNKSKEENKTNQLTKTSSWNSGWRQKSLPFDLIHSIFSALMQMLKCMRRRGKELQILLLSLLYNQKTALKILTVYNIIGRRWEGHCLVIHPTPSTGYNFKYPAPTVRSVLKYFSNQAMNYLKTVFSKLGSVLDWTCYLIHVICQTAGATLSLLECYHHGNWLSKWQVDHEQMDRVRSTDNCQKKQDQASHSFSQVIDLEWCYLMAFWLLVQMVAAFSASTALLFQQRKNW